MKKITQYLMFWLVFIFTRTLLATYRFRVYGLEHRRVAENAHPTVSFALASWHEHLFGNIMAHAGQKIACLTSLSSDGDLVTFVLTKLGYRSVRGSSSRRGKEARSELYDVLKEGWGVAITVDGPRGPRHRVKGGIVDVARKSGAYILPVVALGSQQWVLKKSWDKFKIPKPFARVAVRYGEPIQVPENTEGIAFGEFKQKVKAGLIQVESQAQNDLKAWHEQKDARSVIARG